MKTLSNVLNIIVSLLLFLMGAVGAFFLGNTLEGIMFFVLMSASALCHFLSKRVRFLLVFEGVSVFFGLLACLVIAMH